MLFAERKNIGPPKTRPLFNHFDGKRFFNPTLPKDFAPSRRSTLKMVREPRSRWPTWVCAVERRRFPVGVSPTRQPLQPEATGAVMEVTKWLKPLVSVSRIGDSARVQAVTRVNAEQTSKRTMRRPTRQPFRGRLIWLGEAERRVRPAAAPG